MIVVCRAVLLFTFLLFSMMVSPLYAEDNKADKGNEASEDESGEKPALLTRPIYVPVKPAFVVNYGGPGKLRYFKLEISLRMQDVNASNAARHHMPLIRDYLVKLFTRQTDVDLATLEGKERLRQSALEGIQHLLVEEEGEQGVTDLFFSNFVVQR